MFIYASNLQIRYEIQLSLTKIVNKKGIYLLVSWKTPNFGAQDWVELQNKKGKENLENVKKDYNFKNYLLQEPQGETQNYLATLVKLKKTVDLY